MKDNLETITITCSASDDMLGTGYHCSDRIGSFSQTDNDNTDHIGSSYPTGNDNIGDSENFYSSSGENGNGSGNNYTSSLHKEPVNQILAGKILSQYSEVTGKSLNEIDQSTLNFVNTAGLATLEQVYNANMQNKKEILVGKVLSEASKYGLNNQGYQIQINNMSWEGLSQQYENWKGLEKQILVGKVLSEADKYSLNSSIYQQQVNKMSFDELSKQHSEWKILERKILVGKVLSQVNEITGKSDFDNVIINFVNNSELSVLQLINNTNLNQKQLLSNGSISLYKLYFILPMHISYKIMYGGQYLNSDINKLFTRQLDLQNISSLNLSNSHIGDEGAKLISDSLVKDEMPKLKVIRVEGNQFTRSGQGVLIDALKNISKDILISLEKYSNVRQQVIKPALKEFIKHAEEQGVDTTHVATNKTAMEYFMDAVSVGWDIFFGALKCEYKLLEIVTLDTNVPSLAADLAVERYGTKLMKKGHIGLCIYQEVEGAITSPEGVGLAIKAVELIGEE